MSQLSPQGIAHQTLALLQSRKLAPTPINYRSHYHEVAGIHPSGHFPEEVLCKFVQFLPAIDDEQRRDLIQAIEHREWKTLSDILLDYSADRSAGEQATADSANADMQDGLLRLLQLIIANIGELSMEDTWLKGQVDLLLNLTQNGLTLAQLSELERRLRDLIHKQSRAKAKSLQAQLEMREMMAAFMDRLAHITNLSGSYQHEIKTAAVDLQRVKTIEEISPILNHVLQATRSMEHDSQLAHAELSNLSEQSARAELEIRQLREELGRVSAEIRHDPLTGVLNRKGLDEAMAHELSHSQRQQAALCLALLDLDNFKALNDTHGHAVGDQALKQLAHLARISLRPQDSVARYGGEEFVVLMPDTELQHGVEVITRLQHSLSLQTSLLTGSQLNTTFSAGVAQLRPGETVQAALQRADSAMYQAKRSGKNKVMGD